MRKSKFTLVAAMSTIGVGICLCIYISKILGIFSANQIVVTTLATTGPDFEVVFGSLKLKEQLPDTSVSFDLSGVMTTGSGSNELGNYLNDHYLAFGDYFVLNEKVIGIKKSDTDDFHPLIEISAWRHIDKIKLWLLSAFTILVFILGIQLYKKYSKLTIPVLN